VLTTAGSHPFDLVKWEKTNVKITDETGNVLYELNGAEFPSTWSKTARKITANKYFRESRDSKDKETSLKETISRIVAFIGSKGVEYGYFEAGSESSLIYESELTHILLHQMAAFNSPVWFNAGVPGIDKPLLSACFINRVEDSMDSILNLAKTEGLIFKEGAGSGVNFSNLRASTERIRGGGTASGPVSFMQGYDAFANVIMSGGRTRRSARMCVLNADHPDIEKFISCKNEQEAIVERLIKGGMSPKFNDQDGAYSWAKHQTGNNSVRVTNEFMERVRQHMYYGKEEKWNLINRADGSVARTVDIGELFTKIAECAHGCGDPAVLFHDSFNAMNTCAADFVIQSVNPCGEYAWVENSACNLSSINLTKFMREDNTFDTKLFKHTVRMLIISQDIIVEAASYPTKDIEMNSLKYRPLGLGYANIGGLLMRWGIPYDSDKGREIAASITSLMTAQAYLTSAEVAAVKGAFSAYEYNKVSMEEVLNKHRAFTKKIPESHLQLIAYKAWGEAIAAGFGRKKEEGSGYRNAQVTVLAPTGSISFAMDCDTTGVEPAMGLVTYKDMVGGGTMKITVDAVPEALMSLGYSTLVIPKILQYISDNGYAEGCPELKEEHLPVFDCAFLARTRMISVEGHINMCAAVQPFLSGAISKTFNMPTTATVEDIKRAYMMAWERGLKGVAIYRQGSKFSEPMRAREVLAAVEEKKSIVPTRKELPTTIISVRHVFNVGAHKIHLHCGLDPKTGDIMEIFIRAGGFGSTVGGLLDSYATLFSKSLQYGIPLDICIKHMEGSNFPPAGVTSNAEIPMVKSIMDYVARWMKKEFIDKKAAPIVLEHPDTENGVAYVPHADDAETSSLSEDTCPKCGHLMVRTGSCTMCKNCSHNSGVCG
jgi:ribonucleoside-diphosphate reductase alpha chain